MSNASPAPHPRSRSSAAQRFAWLAPARRVWAVSCVHGEVGRLRALHGHLRAGWEEGDRLVYLGNLMGWGASVTDTLDEVLRFRRELLCRPGLEPRDIAYLRGSQEEMWQKLLRLQFAQAPADVLRWMLEQGAAATLTAYGGTAEDGYRAAAQGPLALARWTNGLRRALAGHPGHEALLSSIRRAAIVEDRSRLFVHAGLDPAVPLADQGDVLWWGGGFSKISEAYEGFRIVVRGADRAHVGVQTTRFTATVDGGCGFGGPLLAACFDPEGRIVDLLEGDS